MRPSEALQQNRENIRHKLKILLGVSVDVLTPNSLPANFRDKIIKETVPV